DAWRNEAFLSGWQRPLQVIGKSMEKGQRQGAGIIEALDPIGHPLIVRRRWPVTPDRDFDRYDAALREFGDFRPVTAVDETGRKVKQEIDDPRRRLNRARPQELGQELFELG